MSRRRTKWLIALLATCVCSITVVVLLPRIRFALRFESLGRNEQGYPEYRQRDSGIIFVRLPGGTAEIGSTDEQVEKRVADAKGSSPDEVDFHWIDQVTRSWYSETRRHEVRLPRR